MKRESGWLAATMLASIMAIGGVTNYLGAGSVSSAPPPPMSDDPDAVKAIAGYRGWTKVNAIPVLMEVRVALDCAAPAGGFRTYDDTNPHFRKYITVYVNASGRQAMMEEAKPKFPEGSVIVKEKLAEPSTKSPELLTVMIKRERGFNPESGDWEYAVFDGTGTKLEARGKLAKCQSCHVNIAKSDYIFRTYLPFEVRDKLK